MRRRVLLFLGATSYCVYHIHAAILIFAHSLLLHGAPQISNLQEIAVTLFAAVLTLGLAALSLPYFEKPLIRRGHTYAFVEETAVGGEA